MTRHAFSTSAVAPSDSCRREHLGSQAVTGEGGHLRLRAQVLVGAQAGVSEVLAVPDPPVVPDPLEPLDPFELLGGAP
jgi:hypothetical protein